MACRRCGIFTFRENFFVDYSKNQAFSHVWSLCVDEHFYLLLPIIVLAMLRRVEVWKTVAVLAFFAVLGLGTRSYEYFYVQLPMGRGAIVSLWNISSASTTRRMHGSMGCWRVWRRHW
jgi:peptidoglycan/LPS O-acetylase OafA/YrhL